MPVRFAETVQVKEYEKESPGKLASDITYVKDVLVYFLNMQVSDVLNTAGQHFTSLVETNGKPSATHYPPKEIHDHVNTQRVSAQFLHEMNRLIYPYTHSQNSLNNVEQFLATVHDMKISHVIHLHLYPTSTLTHSQKKILEFACLVLIRLGLPSFLMFKHCKNKCYRVMQFDKNILQKSPSKQGSKLYNVCKDAYEDIRVALNIHDGDASAFRAFDALLKKASNDQCSLFENTNV